MKNSRVGIEDLLGKTLVEIYGGIDSCELWFHTDEYKYKMYHGQCCCESVWIEDIIGDLNDLVGSPITMAEKVSNADEPEDANPETVEYADYSATWTFYKLATVKGYVTIRWFGTSNGYYSEEVDIMRYDNE